MDWDTAGSRLPGEDLATLAQRVRDAFVKTINKFSAEAKAEEATENAVAREAASRTSEELTLDLAWVEQQTTTFSSNRGTNLPLLERRLTHNEDELPRPPDGMPRFAAESAVVELGRVDGCLPCRLPGYTADQLSAMPNFADQQAENAELRRALKAALEQYEVAKEASYVATEYRDECARKWKYAQNGNDAAFTDVLSARPVSPSFSSEWPVTLLRMRQRHHDAFKEFAHATVDERLAYNAVAHLLYRYRRVTNTCSLYRGRLGLTEQLLKDDREALIKFREILPLGPHATDRPLYLPHPVPQPLPFASRGPSRPVRCPVAVAPSWATPTSAPPPPLDDEVRIDPSHWEEVHQKIAACLRNDSDNPERGQHNADAFMRCVSHPIVHGGASNETVLETTTLMPPPLSRLDFPSPLPSPPDSPPSTPPKPEAPLRLISRAEERAAMERAWADAEVEAAVAASVQQRFAQSVAEAGGLVTPVGNPFPSPLPSPPDSTPSTPPEPAGAAADAAATGATPSPDAAAAAVLLTVAAEGGSNLSRTRVRAFIKASRAHRSAKEAALASSPASAASAAPAAASGPPLPVPGTPSSSMYQRYVSTPRPAASSAYTELMDANKSILELTDYIDVCREAILELRRQHHVEMTERAKKTEEVVRLSESRKAEADKALVSMKQECDDCQAQTSECKAEVRRLTLDNTRVQSQYDEAVLIQDQAKTRARELSLKLSESEDQLSEIKIRMDRAAKSRNSLLEENEEIRQRLKRFESSPSTMTDAEALEAAQKKCTDLTVKLTESAERNKTLEATLRVTEREHAAMKSAFDAANVSLAKATSNVHDSEDSMIQLQAKITEREEEVARYAGVVQQLQQQLEAGPAGTSPPTFASPGIGQPINRMRSLADVVGGTLGAPSWPPTAPPDVVDGTLGASNWPPPPTAPLKEGRLPGATLPGAAHPGATPPPPLDGPPRTSGRAADVEAYIKEQVGMQVAAIARTQNLIQDDDVQSVADSQINADPSRWVEFLNLPLSDQLKMFDASSHKQTIREVLLARIDPTSKRWRRRNFTTEEVVSEWALQMNSRVVHRDAADSMRQLEKLTWDSKLGDSDRDVQAATWDNTRRKMISCLGEALITGCALKRLLNRFYNSVDQKNKRIATYIKNILEDPTLINSGFAPLVFDVFMYDTDSSYRTANYGQDTAESEWRMLKGRDASEDCVTLGSRVFNAYLQLKDDHALTTDHTKVWSDSGHTESVNQKIASCLRDDPSHPERGRESASVFMKSWNRAKLHVSTGTANCSELSGLKILKYDVEVDENDRNYSSLPDKTPKTNQPHQPNQQQRRVAGAAVPSDSPPPPLVPDDTRDAANVNPPPAGRGKGDAGRGRGGKGDGGGRGGPFGRGDGRGGGKPTGPGVAPGATAPPPLSGHNTEPPPSNTNQGPRTCAMPEGSKGHPQKRAWTAGDWNSVTPDFDKIDELAITTAGHATAQARPNDASRTTTRTKRPLSTKNDRGQNEWEADACTYCHYRDLAPADVAPGSPYHWWYGTKNGKHSPYRCQPFKRYLAEGGDAAADPAAAPYLQQCLRFAQRQGG